jgi:uncharacterized protein involved in exopolysaccharide biosynthesis
MLLKLRFGLRSLLLCVAIIAVGITWINYLWEYPRHSVTALFFVPARAPQLLETEGHSFDELEFNRFLRTQEVLIRSPLIVEQALAALKPQEAQLAGIVGWRRPADFIERNLRVSWLGESEIMELQLVGRADDPKALAAVLSQIVSAYLAHQSGSDLQNIQREIDLRSEMILRLSDEVDQLFRHVAETKAARAEVSTPLSIDEQAARSNAKRKLWVAEQTLKRLELRQDVAQLNLRSPSRVTLLRVPAVSGP